jgi:sensor histidine kinase YesM
MQPRLSTKSPYASATCALKNIDWGTVCLWSGTSMLCQWLCKYPHSVLQPLLENAIYHGIEPMPQGGTIKITAMEKDNHYYLTIENPTSESLSASALHQGNELAQDNIRQRLIAFFGPAAKMIVTPENNKYRVTITIPVENENINR